MFAQQLSRRITRLQYKHGHYQKCFLLCSNLLNALELWHLVRIEIKLLSPILIYFRFKSFSFSKRSFVSVCDCQHWCLSLLCIFVVPRVAQTRAYILIFKNGLVKDFMLHKIMFPLVLSFYLFAWSTFPLIEKWNLQATEVILCNV